MECKVRDCKRAKNSRGMCQLHYQRWQKSGDPLKTKIIKGNDKLRFEEKIAKTESCWNWIGSLRSKKGYGCFTVNSKTVAAHRYSYQLYVGDIPKGMQLDHTCNNRCCVNPEHLEPVTNRENQYRGYARRGFWPIEGRAKVEKQCEVCGVEVQAVMDWKKYCSNSCKCKAQRARWATV